MKKIRKGAEIFIITVMIFILSFSATVFADTCSEAINVYKKSQSVQSFNEVKK